ncbi:hypothetical protein EV140_0761 [Microcella alkaliphila]|uniref:Uncharacterized protein n=2 Tax=Microcella TaxID=337004 RepID=A0A4Q7LXB4_9MICO|nr:MULTISPECIES: hypothetical protein [Microcella]RZS59665.1 hypothetical protein EV141_0897 [Microcella putealis]RZT62242.1 hypothetical protein EV140_0761 [Microcella alkaliphila]TQM26778.1 hypothetical protein BJ957_0193 [Microcella putealis]
MSVPAKNATRSVSPWVVVLASSLTAWAVLAVSTGIALTVAGPAALDTAGVALSLAGLVALAAIVLRAAWRAPRQRDTASTSSRLLVAVATALAAPLLVAVLVTSASAPSVTNVGLALPVLGVLGGLSNRVRRRTFSAGGVIVALMLALVATIVALRALGGGLESLVTELVVAALAGFVALAIVVLVVTLLTVLLRPAGELSD